MVKSVWCRKKRNLCNEDCEITYSTSTPGDIKEGAFGFSVVANVFNRAQ